VDMIEKDGLIDRFPSKDWKDREKNPFGLNLKPMVGNDGKKKDEDDGHESRRTSSTYYILYETELLSVKQDH